MVQSEVAMFSIGALSKRTGCNIETIRFYERTGVMPAPPRSEGGHRIYSEDHLKRLTFIRRSRELGLALGRVRELLALVDGGDYTCDEIKEMTVRHVADVRDKIAGLRKVKRVLEDMVSQCDRGAVPDCPLVEAMFETKL